MSSTPLSFSVFPSWNNKVPKEGPRYIPMPFKFDEITLWDVDLMMFQQQGKISTLQGFYVDNSDNTSALVIQMGLGGQKITIPAGYQGYVTCLINNVPKFTVESSGGTTATLFALNFPVVTYLWNAAA